MPPIRRLKSPLLPPPIRPIPRPQHRRLPPLLREIIPPFAVEQPLVTQVPVQRTLRPKIASARTEVEAETSFFEFLSQWEAAGDDGGRSREAFDFVDEVPDLAWDGLGCESFVRLGGSGLRWLGWR